MKFDDDLDGVCQELDVVMSAMEKVVRRLPKSLHNKTYVGDATKSLNKAHMNALSALRIAQVERHAQAVRDEA